MLKRFIVFVYEGHEAGGGWHDVLCETSDDDRLVPGLGQPISFDTIGEAVAAATPIMNEMGYSACLDVVDLHTGRIVFLA
mgnify:FL=1